MQFLNRKYGNKQVTDKGLSKKILLSHETNQESSGPVVPPSEESLPRRQAGIRPPRRRDSHLWSYNFGIGGIIRLIRTRPGLFTLITILTVITFGILKPEFYLMGWDNFSSYLNLKNSIFNTLFATWRGHRGLGVPSDAEINDIFRQIFSAFLSLFVYREVVDQIYITIMLWGGVLGMYVLGRYVSGRLGDDWLAKQELFGFIASFFYLFNLSTLAVFYFPMIMYVTRFFMLPTTVYILLRLIDSQSLLCQPYFGLKVSTVRGVLRRAQDTSETSTVSSAESVSLPLTNPSMLGITWRTYLVYLIILFIGMGAFLVPTNFIVIMIMLGLMFIIFRNKAKVFGVISLFVGLNMFWLLVFANYTMQKGSIVPQAPLFIDINESMLNKPKSYYAFKRQAKLRPTFFESRFTNHVTASPQHFHELASHDEDGITSWIIWIFPATYLMGALYIFLFKRRRILVWLAATALIFLLLSMKEYSPVGFIYGFISDHVPFVNTIFRFGDTKFHAMIAFTGSIVSAVLMVRIFSAILHFRIDGRNSRLPGFFRSILIVFDRVSLIRGKHVFRKTIIYAVLFGLIISNLIVYKSFFNGNFIGFFMYNKIPSAYFEIADIINQDPEAVRVIHLPFDSRSYWKPYTWGYFGSAFLHFMLNKPLFDRTFEPASAENADIHQQIMDILKMSSSVSSDKLLKTRALELYQILRALSIKYVIVDGTISTHIEARNISYWGRINPIDSHRLLGVLAKNGYLTLVKQYDVTPKNYSGGYAQLYPYNNKVSDTADLPRSIQLYALVNTAPRIQFLAQVDKVNTAHTSLLLPKVSSRLNDAHYIQAKEYDDQSLIFPFAHEKSKVQIVNGKINILSPIKLSPGVYQFESKDNAVGNQTQMLNVFRQKINGFIRFYFQYPIFPTIEGASSDNSTNYTTIDLKTEADNYRYVKIGSSVLPIPRGNEEDIQFVGSLIIHEETIPVSILYPQDTYNVSNNLVQLEPGPQCLNDGLEDIVSHITGDYGVLKISGQNVSNCLTTKVDLSSDSTNNVSFALLEFDSMGKIESLTQEKQIDTGKPKLTQYINGLKNPLIMHVCVKRADNNTCLNNDSLFRISQDKKKYIVPVVGDLTKLYRLLITFTVRSSQRQKYDTTTRDIVLRTYISGSPEFFSINRQKDYSYRFELKNSSKLNLTIPVAKSDYSQSFSFANDGILIGRDPSCDETGRYQAVKNRDDGILGYIVGCKNFVNKNIPFSSNNYYLWHVGYKHLSGSLPAVILMDGSNTYTYKKLIPKDVNANNYFSIPLQKPESILTSQEAISEKITGAPIYSISDFIEPRFDYNNNSNKEFIIEQFSQNEGLIELKNMSLVELPNYWVNSRIHPVNYQPVKYQSEAQILSFKRILPSLWRVKTNAKKEGEYLVLFNEQYDDQWSIFGVQTLLHARCDGYANCYKIKLSNGKSTLYLFYKPELLNFFGFIVTVLYIYWYWSSKRIRA